MKWPSIWGRGWSLRRALIAAGVGLTLISWLAGGLVTTHFAERTQAELLDRGLYQVANLLLGLSAHEIDEIGDDQLPAVRIALGRAESGPLGNSYRYQIWSDDGHLLLGNFSSGTHASAPMAPFLKTGYSICQIDGEAWRVYSQHDPAMHKQIQMAERLSDDGLLWAGVDGSIVALLALSLLFVLTPALWLPNRLMRPINSLAQELEGSEPHRLAPVVVHSLPQELSPVVGALNRLFDRLDQALQNERNFTGVAAHELRTPLATVRMLAQAVRTADSASERDESLDQLIIGTDRCAHLIDQLLTLQRLDAAGGSPTESVDLADVVMEALSANRAEADRRQVHLSAKLDGSSMRGHRFGVLTLVRNLVSNAVIYTPASGRVKVSTERWGDDVVVMVDDSGPGIAPEDRDRALGRFQRLNAVAGTGVGLGLSIVRTVALAHGAGLALEDSPLGGLRVRVDFKGRAEASAPIELTESDPAPHGDGMALPTG